MVFGFWKRVLGTWEGCYGWHKKSAGSEERKEGWGVEKERKKWLGDKGGFLLFVISRSFAETAVAIVFFHPDSWLLENNTNIRQQAVKILQRSFSMSLQSVMWMIVEETPQSAGCVPSVFDGECLGVLIKRICTWCGFYFISLWVSMDFIDRFSSSHRQIYTCKCTWQYAKMWDYETFFHC